jgi:uncharacterized protein (DUF1499 family)
MTMSVNKWLVLAVLVIVGLWLSLAWPRLNDVETGRTPEYSDLQPREYAAPPDRVLKAATAAVEGLGWTYVGSGQGPGGSELKAIARTPILRFSNDITVRIRRASGRTTVSVRSESRYGKWDFGQNARNIRTLLGELDRQLN